MKKIIALMLVAVMMVMALTSCDIVDKILDNDTETETKQETTETRYTITAEEWEALNTVTNYTCRSVGAYTMSYNGESKTQSVDVTNKATETSFYQKSTIIDNDEDHTSETYYAIRDGVEYLLYKYEDGTYIGYVSSDDVCQSLGEYIGCTATFEDLTYDEATHSYTFTETRDGMKLHYNFYFENGKLVKMVRIGSGDIPAGEGISYHMEAEATMTVSNIDTTVVEVPEFTIR